MNIQLPLGRGVGAMSVFTVAVFGVEVVEALGLGKIVSIGAPIEITNKNAHQLLSQLSSLSQFIF